LGGCWRRKPSISVDAREEASSGDLRGKALA